MTASCGNIVPQKLREKKSQCELHYNFNTTSKIAAKKIITLNCLEYCDRYSLREALPCCRGNLKITDSTWPIIIEEYFVTSHLCFQGVIRASVTQDHHATETKPLAPLLEIKLPVPTAGIGGKHSPSLASTVHLDNSGTEEDGEDDDDWDAFQSFPASTSAAGKKPKLESPAKELGLVENSSVLKIDSGSNDFQEYSISQPQNIVEEEINHSEHQGAGEEAISDSQGSQASPQNDAQSTRSGMHEFHTSVIKPCDDQESAVSSKENEQRSSNLQSVEVAAGSVEVNDTGDNEVRKENPDNKDDLISSDSLLPREELSYETHGEGILETQREPQEADEEAQKKMTAEIHSSDHQPESVDYSGTPVSEEDNARL